MRGVLLSFVVALLAACDRTATRPPASPQTPAPVDTTPLTSTLIELANHDLARGRWLSAKRRADDALLKDPNNADAHAVLGAAYWLSGDWTASTAAFTASLARDANNFGAAVALGRNLQAAGDLAGAIALQDRLLAVDPNQREPLQVKLWSQYALLDVDGALTTIDRLFDFVDMTDELRPLLLAYAGFLRPLAGQGPQITFSGTSGASDLQIDPTHGSRTSLGVLGSEVTRVVLLEYREEARVHRPLADKLKLRELGKFTPLHTTRECAVVVIPELAFGDLKIRNIPAIVDDLAPFTSGEPPGVMLGRQVLQRIGAITYDLPRATLELQLAAPAAPPPGSFAAPLLLLDAHAYLTPVTTLSIDGSPHTFSVMFGGLYDSSLTITREEYLKSGHLPRALEHLDDPAAGLQMVWIDGAKIGDAALPGGLGGLVLANTPPDQLLEQIRRTVSFDVGGYINTPLYHRVAVTYALSSGKLYLKPRP